ncbi:MAG: pilin [Halieaceae bacterium]|mgnify:FL=1|jgi:type IV pilus assembly protein PilA|nr:pilin [Halieaceae bacterium]
MSNRKRQPNGFTLIELMVIIAVISILMLVAIPAYMDYSVRAQVSEGLAFISEAKTSVTNAYYGTNKLPENNTKAGLPPADSYDSLEYVSRLEVGSVPVPGTITVTIKVPSLGADNKLQLVPSTINGLLNWTCAPAATNGIAMNRVPANCRGS